MFFSFVLFLIWWQKVAQCWTGHVQVWSSNKGPYQRQMFAKQDEEKIAKKHTHFFPGDYSPRMSATAFSRTRLCLRSAALLTSTSWNPMATKSDTLASNSEGTGEGGGEGFNST